jgi:signal transduction histidine kinase/CheY-like chemotaxis protein
VAAQLSMPPVVRLASAIALAVIVTAAFVAYRNTRELLAEGAWVEHTHDVRTAIADLRALVQTAESSQRGYLLTGDRAYLAAERVATARIPRQLDRMATITADNGDHQRLVPELSTAIRRKLHELAAAIKLRKHGDVGAAITVRGDASRLETEHIGSLLGEMDRNEEALLHVRIHATRAAATVAATTFAAAAGIAATLLIFIYHLMRRNLAERARAGDERERLLVAAERARAEAEAASRAKDDFLATVSHELRTPLSPILAWTHMLRQGTLDEARASRALEVIEHAARSQAQLIEDLLDVSRIVAGKLNLNIQPVDVAAVAQAAIDVVRPAAEAKGVTLTAVLHADAGRVSGDAGRLQQVVWNLLSNAIKFTPRGGRVTVTVARVDSHVDVAVEDTGEGIRPEFLVHVFERFRQADGGPARTHGGLGLGLAICRHITEAHGGSIRAASAGVGRGALFRVSLPALAREGAAAVAPMRDGDGRHGAVARTSLAGVRVLLVDDEPDSNEVVRLVLASRGADVRVAASAPQARDVLQRWDADVLVSDIAMPGEDGYALIGTMRRTEERWAHVPAVALTAYASRDDRIRLLAAGFQAHVPKPVDAGELVSVVESLARRAGKSANQSG